MTSQGCVVGICQWGWAAGPGELGSHGGLNGRMHPFVTRLTKIIYIYHMVMRFLAVPSMWSGKCGSAPSQLGEAVLLRRVGGHAALMENCSPPTTATCTAAPSTWRLSASKPGARRAGRRL